MLHADYMVRTVDVVRRTVAGVTMSEALDRWWCAQGGQEGEQQPHQRVRASARGAGGGHHYADCIWSEAGVPCNSTC